MYVNDDGFTINDISFIIRKQYKKFYRDYEEAIKEGRTPKYLPENVIDFDELSIRFAIKKKEIRGGILYFIRVGVDT